MHICMARRRTPEVKIEVEPLKSDLIPAIATVHIYVSCNRRVSVQRGGINRRVRRRAVTALAIRRIGIAGPRG